MIDKKSELLSISCFIVARRLIAVADAQHSLQAVFSGVAQLIVPYRVPAIFQS